MNHEIVNLLDLPRDECRRIIQGFWLHMQLHLNCPPCTGVLDEWVAMFEIVWGENLWPAQINATYTSRLAWWEKTYELHFRRRDIDCLARGRGV